MMKLTEIANILKQKNNFYILTHKYPDGDTLGSALALCLALRSINKKANVILDQSLPNKYLHIFDNIDINEKEPFAPEYIISVDVADTALLGENLLIYENKINLCIDHHISNSNYADNCFVNPSAAATAEIIYELIKIMNIPLTKKIATCIYTGISTDTGCFRYSNVTPETHIVASEILKSGIDHASINHIALESVSKSQLRLKGIAINSVQFYLNDKLALICITKDMLKKVGLSDNDIDGISSITRNIEGVLLGVTLIEKENNSFKVSMRSDNTINVSEICREFGGGGHPCAAGCTLTGSLFEVKEKILTYCKKRIENLL